MQFEADDLVKVRNDKERIPAWIDDIVKHVSQPKNEIRVDCLVTAEHPKLMVHTQFTILMMAMFSIEVVALVKKMLQLTSQQNAN